MYEDMTFENIMDRCLDRVSSSIDKREGSVVYDAIAPAAAELAIMYIELAYLMDRAFPDIHAFPRIRTAPEITRSTRSRSTVSLASVRPKPWETSSRLLPDRRLQTMGSASTAKSECMWKKRTVPGVVLPRPTITERSRSKSRPIQSTLTQSMKRRSPRFLTW